MPSFFIENFEIPPFLLPIFQAAGAAYGIPWQVLAAINEVETDYGRDLVVSSAGAEGWMQFLPSSWAHVRRRRQRRRLQDPYNPADAIFAAARYLHAAGGDANIRGAVFSYNHSQAYVSSVMLRAQLLGGTPSELLGAITGLTEARFPVHAAAHFADGFPTVAPRARARARRSSAPRSTRRPGSPVIAAQDGEVEQIGDSPSLGRFVTLRDAYGNTYTYARLGDVAARLPGDRAARRLEASARSSRAAPPRTGAERPRDRRRAAALAGLRGRGRLGPRARRRRGPRIAAGRRADAAPAPAPAQPTAPQTVAPHVQAFREGSNEVYLHPLRPGVQVIAGTVLGHVGATAQAAKNRTSSSRSARPVRTRR